MEIIATTKEGVLIQATKREVQAIQNAVNGKHNRLDEIQIGDKLPAIDYSATITKVKTLGEDHAFTQVVKYAESFNEGLAKLLKVIEEAKNIQI